MTRLEFGADVPCPKCRLTGKVPAPPMSPSEARVRAEENRRRAARRQEPLPKPDRLVRCPRCDGRGVLPRVDADASKGPDWQETPRSGVDVQ